MKLAVKDSLNQFSPLKLDILYNFCKLGMARILRCRIHVKIGPPKMGPLGPHISSEIGTWDPYYQDPHFSWNMETLYENGDLLYCWLFSQDMETFCMADHIITGMLGSSVWLTFSPRVWEPSVRQIFNNQPITDLTSLLVEQSITLSTDKSTSYIMINIGWIYLQPTRHLSL